MAQDCLREGGLATAHFTCHYKSREGGMPGNMCRRKPFGRTANDNCYCNGQFQGSSCLNAPSTITAQQRPTTMAMQQNPSLFPPPSITSLQGSPAAMLLQKSSPTSTWQSSPYTVTYPRNPSTTYNQSPWNVAPPTLSTSVPGFVWVDLDVSCCGWAAYEECGRNPRWMYINCPIACQVDASGRADLRLAVERASVKCPAYRRLFLAGVRLRPSPY